MNRDDPAPRRRFLPDAAAASRTTRRIIDIHADDSGHASWPPLYTPCALRDRWSGVSPIADGSGGGWKKKIDSFVDPHRAF